jgi:sodium transport system permease protein
MGGRAMRAILTVFRKEMIDHLRDRRSILVAMIYPLLGPLLLGTILTFSGGSMQVVDGEALYVPVVNEAAAPDLVDFLRRQGAIVAPGPDNQAAEVLSGRVPFVLIVSERPPGEPQGLLPVKLVTNPSRFDSIAATGRIIDFLNRYEREVVDGRLRAAGLSAGIAKAVTIEEENVGRAVGPAVILLSMIPPFLIFTLFTGGVHVALDSTCGERERGSFEPLMINPVQRWQVLAGKLGAAMVFTLIALGVQAIAFWIMLNWVPQGSLGLVARPTVWRLLLIVSVCLPLVVLAAATQLLISAVTRSMKEAQTYLGLLPLIPGLAGMVLVLAPIRMQPLLAAIPTFGQTLLMGQLVRSEGISLAFLVMTVVATLVVTGLLLLLGFRLYEREDMLFAQ